MNHECNSPPPAPPAASIPPQVTVDGGALVDMPGALAAAYVRAGGRAVLMGKPAPVIYNACAEVGSVCVCVCVCARAGLREVVHSGAQGKEGTAVRKVCACSPHARGRCPHGGSPTGPTGPTGAPKRMQHLAPGTRRCTAVPTDRLRPTAHPPILPTSSPARPLTPPCSYWTSALHTLILNHSVLHMDG